MSILFSLTNKGIKDNDGGGLTSESNAYNHFGLYLVQFINKYN